MFQPFIQKRLRIHDTCGVHNLHGMPGVLAGIFGALMAGLATENTYHYSLYEVTTKISQFYILGIFCVQWYAVIGG